MQEGSMNINLDTVVELIKLVKEEIKKGQVDPLEGRKVYCPLAPYGVCEGLLVCFQFNMETMKSRAEVFIQTQNIGVITIDEKWVFDTYEDALITLKTTGGDQPE